VLIEGKWSADWRGLRKLSTKVHRSPEFDVCISFAGEDREVAKRIASLIKRNGMKRKVFYDDFERATLWGEELARHLHTIYSQQSRFCVILFSQAYSRKVWTLHEYRSALTRVAREQDAYVLPIALDVATIPEEFASVGYWPFNPGDERRIANAVEEKINEYLSQHYVSIEELVEIFNADRAASAILDGFREGIQERVATGDLLDAQIMTVLALISAADIKHLDKSTRALIDLILFSSGAIGDSFEGDSVSIVGDASVRRFLGPHGPFLFSVDAWEPFLERYKISDDALEPDPTELDAMPEDDTSD